MFEQWTQKELAAQKKQDEVDKAKMAGIKMCDDFEALINQNIVLKESVKYSSVPNFNLSVSSEIEESSSALSIEQNTVVEISSESESDCKIIPLDIIASKNENEPANKNKPAKKNVPGNKNEQANKNESKNIALNGVILKREDILEATNSILEQSRNVTDQILGIEVRNCLGEFRIPDTSFTKLQKVLNKWNEWQMLLPDKYINSPLFYKCYICQKSWWFLNDFTEHLNSHTDYDLRLEKHSMHETNIVAYPQLYGTKKGHYETEGNCPKCGRGYDLHSILNRKENMLYKCTVKTCNVLSTTCVLLKEHELINHTLSEITQPPFQMGNSVIFCDYCGVLFHCPETYIEHMNLMHTVRSDSVMPLLNSKCKSSYSYKRHQCPLCFKRFGLANQIITHRKNGTYSCVVCSAEFNLCMKVIHMLKHSDKYAVVSTCMVCEDFNLFSSFKEVEGHVIDVHKVIFKMDKHCSNMLIPKLCVTRASNPTMREPNQQLEPLWTPEDTEHQDCAKDIVETSTNTNTNDKGTQYEISYEIEILQNDVTEEKSETQSETFDVNLQIEEKLNKEIQVDIESESEDDIIKLDFTYLQNIQQQNTLMQETDNVDDDIQEIIEIKEEFEETENVDDDLQETNEVLEETVEMQVDLQETDIWKKVTRKSKRLIKGRQRKGPI